MKRLKAVLSNKFFYPVLILYYGISYIIFGEVYYFDGGLSADGFVYFDLAVNYERSFFFDSFYIHRLLPSVIMGTVFRIFSVPLELKNFVIGFQILNLLCIVVSLLFINGIFEFMNIIPKNRFLGFSLFVMSFAILKFPFFLPIMTDCFAMAISSAMLYCYFKKNQIGVIVTTIMACFTWQMLFYQGVLLIALPFNPISLVEFSKTNKNIIRSGVALISILTGAYLLIFENLDTSIEFIAKINRPFLPISLIGVGLLYFFFSNIILNVNLFNIKQFFKKLNVSALVFSISVLVFTSALIYYFNPPDSKFYPLSTILKNPFAHALMWPLHTVVSHAAYWGVFVVLLLMFWTSTAKLISQLGWGIVTALALNILTFGIMPETRMLINIFPWLLIFLIKAINRFSFSRLFYITVVILSFGASKVWVDLRRHSQLMIIDENGSMGLPDQKLWMNVGPWMNIRMYFVQWSAIFLVFLILFFLLYGIRKNNFSNRLEVYKKF